MRTNYVALMQGRQSPKVEQSDSSGYTLRSGCTALGLGLAADVQQFKLVSDGVTGLDVSKDCPSVRCDYGAAPTRRDAAAVDLKW